MSRDWQEGMIDPESLAADPLDEFLKWYGMAKASDDLLPEAMALATVTREGTPTLRVVLMRGCDERGVSFFTNHDSPKCRRYGSKSSGCVGLSLEADLQAGSDRRSGRPSLERRIQDLLGFPASRQPSGGVGFKAERGSGCVGNIG